MKVGNILNPYGTGNPAQAISNKIAGKGRKVSTMQVQTSVYGLGVPIVYGRNRVAGNLIWYGDFKGKNAGGKGGGKGGAGGGKGGSAQAKYSSSVMIALAMGPIGGVGTIWEGQSVKSLAQLGATVKTGTNSQTPWTYLTSKYPSQALPYVDIAYVAMQNYDLGSSPVLPNLTFEVDGQLQYGGGNTDSLPSDFIPDFLNRAAWPTSKLYSLTDFQDYCKAYGFFFSPVIQDIRSAGSYLNDWLEACACDAVMTEGKLKFLPRATLSKTGNGVTWNPSLTPQYNLTRDDFITRGDEDPVRAKRADGQDAYNQCKIEYTDKTKRYDPGQITVEDRANIDLFGLRTGSPITLNFVTDPNVATACGQAALFRSNAVRTTFEFSLGWKHCLLEAGDYVTITDTDMGLSNELVRITSIDEDDYGELRVIAEEVPGVVASAAVYTSEPTAGFAFDYNVSPGSINAPVLFEPPSDITTSGNGCELWMGVSGSDANWGGCEIYSSLDGVTYSFVTRVARRCMTGLLTANLPSASGTDITNTLSVNCTQSRSVIPPSTNADADALNSLCYVDGELIAYSNSASTAEFAFNLTRLVRGAYGSTVGAHVSGSKFARLDSNIAKLPFRVDQIGQTVYLKFLSFNLFGGGLQGLADVSAYTWTFGGAGIRDTVEISASGMAFTFNGSAVLTPSSQTLTFIGTRATSADPLSWVCTRYDSSNTVIDTVTLGGTGDIRTLTGAQFGAADHAVIVASQGSLSDTITIYRLEDGSAGTSAVTGFLTNESHTAAADSSGTVASFSGAGGTFKMFSGITDITTGNSVAYSIVGTPANISVTINGTTGVYSITDLTADQSTVTFQAVYGAVTIQKVYSISKSKAGVNAQMMYLTSTGQAFTYDGLGNFDPASQTLSFTANLIALSGTAAFTCTYYNSAGTSLGTITMGGSGNTRTLIQSQIPGTAAYLTVSATLSGFTDQMTVMKLFDGSDSLVGYLTNEAAVLPANNAGTVSDFSGASGNFKVFLGVTDKTSNCTYAIQSIPGGVTATINASTGAYSVSAMTPDSALITFRATLAGVGTIDKVLSLSKSKTGAAGTNGNTNAAVILYKRTTTNTVPTLTAGDLATNATYTFATGAIANGPSGWTTAVPANSGGPYLWAIFATASGAGGAATDTIVGTEWSSPPIISVQDGFTPITFDAPSNTSFQAYYTGALKPSQTPRTLYVKAMEGATDVSASCTWTITYNNCNGTNSNGTITIGTNQVYGPGSINITATKGGINYYWNIIVDWEQDLPPQGGSGGGTSASDPSWNSFTSSTHVTITDDITVTTGPSGQVDLSAPYTFYADWSAAGNTNMYTKWQRNISGTWTDVGTEVQSTTPFKVLSIGSGEYEVTDGAGANTKTVTGLGASTSHTFRLQARSTQATRALYPSGTATAVGS